MENFYVEFKNDVDTLVLKFKVYDTPIAQKWFLQLASVLVRDLIKIKKIRKLRENDRMYDFLNDEWSEQNIVDSLNCCIDTINNYKQFINEKSFMGCTPDDTNDLHKYFEIMRGRKLDPGEYFTNAPNHIKLEIDRFNVLIHRLEYYHKTTKFGKLNPRFVVTFSNIKRFLLSDEDFNQFALDSDFGEVYINYCEVGKSLLNVYDDKDEVVGDKSIIPQKYYSADFGVRLYNRNRSKSMPAFWEWWDKKSNYLSALGFNKTDKNLALGTIQVAKLIETMDRKELINKLSKFDKIHDVFL